MRTLLLAWVAVLAGCGGTVEVLQSLPNGSAQGGESQALPSYAELTIIEEFSEAGTYFTVELAYAGALDGVHGAWCVDPDTFSSMGSGPAES